jgi:hypothetical protein
MGIKTKIAIIGHPSHMSDAHIALINARIEHPRIVIATVLRCKLCKTLKNVNTKTGFCIDCEDELFTKYNK